MEILCFIAAVVASIVAVVAKLKAFFLQKRVLQLESDYLHQKRIIELEQSKSLQVKTDLSLTMTAAEKAKNNISALEADFQSLKDDNYSFKKSFSNDLILQKKDFANYVELQQSKEQESDDFWVKYNQPLVIVHQRIEKLEFLVSEKSGLYDTNFSLLNRRFSELEANIAEIKCFITAPQPSKEKVQEVEALINDASNLLQKKAKRASRKKNEKNKVSLLEKAKCDCEITNDFPS